MSYNIEFLSARSCQNERTGVQTGQVHSLSGVATLNAWHEKDIGKAASDTQYLLPFPSSPTSTNL